MKPNISYLYRNTYQRKIIIMFILFVILPFSIANMAISRILERNIEQKIALSSQEALQLKVSIIEDIFKEMGYSAAVFAMDTDILNILNNPDEYSSYKKLSHFDNNSKIVTSSIMRKYKSYATLLDFKGNIYTNWPFKKEDYKKIIDQEWYNEIINSRGEFIWINHKNDVIIGTDEDFKFADISIGSIIYGLNSDEKAGVIIISIPAGEVETVLEESDFNSHIFLVDEGGELVWERAAEKNSLYSSGIHMILEKMNNEKGYIVEEIDSQRYFINYYSFGRKNWKLIGMVAYESIFSEITEIRRNNYFINIIILIAFSGITILLSKSISKRLKDISSRLLEFNDDNMDIRLDESGTLEIITLARSFNRMVDKMKRLVEKNKNEEKKRQEARFNALQAQIKPHFLFNALNNIKMVAYMSRAEKVGEMISALGSMMEEDMNFNEDMITLEHEINYVRNYLYLQSFRYGENIRVIIDIGEEYNKSKILKLMIQPVVENCLIHGFNNAKAKGSIEIKTIKVEDRFIITVKDDGAGISKEKMDVINERLQSREAEKGGRGVGIYNVNERIRLNYGDDFGIVLNSTQGIGTEVRIVLPYRYAEEEKKNA